MDRQISNSDARHFGFVLFGAGTQGRLMLTHLLNAGLRPDWIADGRSALHGTYIEDIPVRPKESLTEAGHRYVVLASCHIRNMLEDCCGLGVARPILPSGIEALSTIPCTVGMPFPDPETEEAIAQVYQLLADDRSRRVFEKFLLYHGCFNESLFEECFQPSYFPPDLTGFNYSYFVDIGAYTGDTLDDWKKFFWDVHKPSQFHYWAFEPFRKNFQALARRVSGYPDSLRTDITLVPQAVGIQSASFIVEGSGTSAMLKTGSNSSSAEAAVEVVRLDDISGLRPTFIKADVEGFEMNVLHGARRTILDHLPTLAFCVYHHYYDLWRIPLFIASLSDSYRFFMRHHSPLYGETVCYAVSRD